MDEGGGAAAVGDNGLERPASASRRHLAVSEMELIKFSRVGEDPPTHTHTHTPPGGYLGR